VRSSNSYPVSFVTVTVVDLEGLMDIGTPKATTAGTTDGGRSHATLLGPKTHLRSTNRTATQEPVMETCVARRLRISLNVCSSNFD
jgi:hypothetical protein